MQNKNLILVIGGLFIVALVAAAYIYFAGSRPGYGLAKPTPDSRVSQPSPVGETVREMTVAGSEYKFSPGSISVARGEQIRIIFKNSGSLPHNLTINELAVATDTIPGGGSTTIEFTADKTGVFAMFCSVGNHRSLGMEGEVEVK